MIESLMTRMHLRVKVDQIQQAFGWLSNRDKILGQ